MANSANLFGASTFGNARHITAEMPALSASTDTQKILALFIPRLLQNPGLTYVNKV
jgi:hypothetical protein